MGGPGRLLFAIPLASLVALAPTQAAAEKELIGLAKSAVKAEVLGRRMPLPGKGASPKPVFVTIERAGQVIGCRGTLEVRAKSLEDEVVLAARSAAAHDPRYKPLTAHDLDSIKVTVTIVERTEPLTGVRGLDPGDGLVLVAGTKTGIVLPWEGKDPQIRLQWAYRKAGVPEGAPARLFRLIAVRFRG
jgi:MEMO1 family protein